MVGRGLRVRVNRFPHIIIIIMNVLSARAWEKDRKNPHKQSLLGVLILVACRFGLKENTLPIDPYHHYTVSSSVQGAHAISIPIHVIILAYLLQPLDWVTDFTAAVCMYTAANSFWDNQRHIHILPLLSLDHRYGRDGDNATTHCPIFARNMTCFRMSYR